jgi:haloalkane dehalogenase
MTGPEPGWVDRTLFPFTSRFVDIGQSRIHYVDEGSGPTLLFVHGNPGWSFVYRDVISDLSRDFRCVALDLPGFGLSEGGPGYGYGAVEHAEALRGFVSQLGVVDGTLMVNDWGGPLGLSVAERMPDAFSRFVIANTWAWPVTGDWHFTIFSTVMGGPIGRALVTRSPRFFDTMMARTHAQRSLDAAELAQYRGPFPTREARLPVHVLMREIKAAGPWLATVERGLDSLRDRPVLLLWGERDGAFRSVERERFERSFPAARVVRLPGAGNFVASDAPADVAAAIRAWHPHTADSPV